MKSNTEALKDLYLSVGGDGDANLSVIPDIINAIATLIPGIAEVVNEKGLPGVTEVENGKVLTVVDGEWAVADMPTELPKVTDASNGKGLIPMYGTWQVGSIPTRLPVVDNSNNGQVLTVINGAWEPGLEISDDWETIISKIANGTADYSVGQHKPLDLGTQGVINMQIVAAGANASPLASGDGNATYDFVAKELLATKHLMTSSNSPGWENSGLRSYLKNTIKPLIPQVVRDAIKEVSKTSYRYDTNTKNAITTDDVWIPSNREIFGGTEYESQGPIYSGVYTINNNTRVKRLSGGGDSVWWMRSAYKYNNTNYRTVTATGSSSYGERTINNGVALGFSL